MSRLLLATDAWHPQVNGVVRVLDRLHRDAPKFGMEVEVLSPQGFRTIPLPSYSEIRLAMCRPGDVARRIEAAAPDYIHIATEGPIGLTTRRWCKANGRGFTTSFHTRFPEYVAARAPIPPSLTYSWLRRFHNSGLGVMVSTERLAAELRAHGFARPLLWPRGIDLSAFTPGEPAALNLPRPIFAYVGRVAVEKGIEDFLKLDLPGSKMVVGDGPQRVALQSRYPEVAFMGVHEGEDLVRLYRAADVFVFPSRTDTLGLVMIEALACGVPVAAYPVPGPLDVVGESGAGVLDTDLKAAALAALEIPREAALARAAQFDIQDSVRAFVELVKNANAEDRATAA